MNVFLKFCLFSFKFYLCYFFSKVPWDIYILFILHDLGDFFFLLYTEKKWECLCRMFLFGIDLELILSFSGKGYIWGKSVLEIKHESPCRISEVKAIFTLIISMKCLCQVSAYELYQVTPLFFLYSWIEAIFPCMDSLKGRCLWSHSEFFYIYLFLSNYVFANFFALINTGLHYGIT